MRPKLASFLCEHTVEYVLVHNLVKTLCREFECVVPIFLWVTREGTSLASRGIGFRLVRIVTAYARRPKVEGTNDRTISMKINASLFQAAASGLSEGSPVLAGIPLVTNLLEFTMEASCVWFQLLTPVDSLEDVEVRLALDGARIDSDLVCPVVDGPLTTDRILSIIKNNARPTTWDNAVDLMRRIRAQGEGKQHGFSMSGYRPFYLVIPS